MSVRWNREEFDPDSLVARLEGLRVPPNAAIDEDVHFEGDIFFDDVVTVLERALSFSETMTERDRRRLLAEALFGAARSGPLTADALLARVNRGAQKFFRKDPEEYVLATSLSFAYFPELPRSTEVSGCTISFGPWLPEHLRAGHEEAEERMRRYVFGKYPGAEGLAPYCAVWVSAVGRSDFEAADRALATLDLLRGIWNLILNRRKWTRTTARRRRPVNEVLLGPVHSLHCSDGPLASETDWYEYDYVEPMRTTELRKRWDKVQGNEANVHVLLRRSSYRQQLENAVRRYTRALDSREWDSAFVRLWGLLEDLTGTERGNGHEVTVRRAAFQYDDSERWLHVQVLKHLKDYRNRSVHGGESSEDIEAYLYQLKRYVEDTLVFHLQDPWEFSSIEEMACFLDLPTDPAALERKIADLRRNVANTEERIRLGRLAHEFRSGPIQGDGEVGDGNRTDEGPEDGTAGG